ncbi:CRISPR-associated endonuclease Cas1 [uncultured Desulfovibrio sp.]|uniref:CRISPR-associated endonuclease Cas1 n=1 Tax=uncultured Desulfovibrio sp. TaxID=167968 RepID=UPI0026163AB6|nr:CRISPR-associated endonuclease Cas1 [uncultured Desulfovibrio sp.]
MKQHLNTLFVTTQDTWLSKEGECVVLSLEGEKLGKIPLHTLQSIACFGHVACSQYLLERCAQLGITVTQRAVKPRPSGRGYKAHLNWNFCL